MPRVLAPQRGWALLNSVQVKQEASTSRGAQCLQTTLYVAAIVVLLLNLSSIVHHRPASQHSPRSSPVTPPSYDTGSVEVDAEVAGVPRVRKATVSSKRRRSGQDREGDFPVAKREESTGAGEAATREVVPTANGSGGCGALAVDPPVHIMYSSDSKEYQAMLASLYSALRNSKQPGRLRFQLVVPSHLDKSVLCGKLVEVTSKARRRWCPLGDAPSYLPEGVQVEECKVSTSRRQRRAQPATNRTEVAPLVSSCMCGSEQFHIVSFDGEVFADKLSVIQASLMSYKSPDGQVRQELKSDINFARNFADALLLPYGVRQMVYLDVDTIVQGDLVELMDGLSFTDSRWFAASPNCAHRMESWYDFKSVVVRRTMRRRHCYINAGVYVVDLSRYALAGIQERIVQLVASHMRRQIWMQGMHQPSFILALYNYSIPLDHRWNTAGLGWMPDMEERELQRASVLHWTGSHKPWHCDGYYHNLWEPYAVTFQLKGCRREQWGADQYKTGPAAVNYMNQRSSATSVKWRQQQEHASLMQWVKDKAASARQHGAERLMGRKQPREDS